MASTAIDDEEEEEEINDAGGRETPPEAIWAEDLRMIAGNADKG